MRKNISNILICFALIFWTYSIAQGAPKTIATYELSLKSSNWNGKEHSLEFLKSGIETNLKNLNIVLNKSNKTADIKIDLSFELERLWCVSPNEQYLAIELPGILTIHPTGIQQPAVSIAIRGFGGLKFSNEGSAVTQRMEFETYDVAQDICKDLKGGFPEDNLWKSASEDLLRQFTQLLEVTVSWIQTGSVKNVEPLLSSDSYNLIKGAISFLKEVATPDATNLLQKILREDKRENIRNLAKETLEEMGKSK